MPDESAPTKEWLRPAPSPLACYDCHLPYDDAGWMDAVVPNDLWQRISPTGHEGGILCVTCMARRIKALDIQHAFVKITSGPFA